MGKICRAGGDCGVSDAILCGRVVLVKGGMPVARQPDKYVAIDLLHEFTASPCYDSFFRKVSINFIQQFSPLCANIKNVHNVLQRSMGKRETL